MFPFYSSLLSLLPEGGKAFVAGLHPEMLRAWLESLSGKAPEEAAQALGECLGGVRATPNLHSRLKMLDVLYDATDRVASALEAELHQARHPLALDIQHKVLAGNGLLKRHARAYRAAAEQFAGMWIGRRNGLASMQQALLRAMELESRRLMLAFRAYTPGSKSAWHGLHALHRMARIHSRSGDTAKDTRNFADGIYVRTLLTALAEPARLPPGDLDRLRFYLARYAPLARLREPDGIMNGQEPCEGCFLIRQRDDGPGRSVHKWAGMEFSEDDLVLDCGPLLSKLRSQLDALTHGALPSKIGLPAVARRPAYTTLLRNITALWSAPPTRRYSRQHFRPRVELVAGFEDLWSFLSGASLRRRRGDDTVQTSALRPPSLSEWSVANESPAGFALQYVSGACNELAVGALVGLHPREHGTVHVCLVRRLVSGDRRRTDLGVQKYAPGAVPTTIAPAADADLPPVKAIVLPRVPSLGGAAAVIVPPGALLPGRRVPYSTDGTLTTRLAGAPIERCAAYEIFSLGDPG